MAETKTKKKPAAKKTTSSSTKKKKNGPVAYISDELDALAGEAFALEVELEKALLRDAVLTAKVALEALRSDLHGPPHERRRGIRLRDKALKVERAFNRLRALRRGDLLPERHPDD